MTVKLAEELSGQYSHAKIFDTFFEQQGIEIRAREKIREGSSDEAKNASCKTNLFFGFFFDGTKNNYIHADTANNHSNVARLYDCFPGLSVPGVLPTSTDWKRDPQKYTHFFKVYVPGVSSPFSQVRDTGTGADAKAGAAAGALAERRIIWALLQAVNNLHRYFLKAPMVSAEETMMLCREITLNKYFLAEMAGAAPRSASGTQNDERCAARRGATSSACSNACSSRWRSIVQTTKPASRAKLTRALLTRFISRCLVFRVARLRPGLI